ncbi:hypothetical protein B0O80DRAFT_444469 [Mortierella sp. GBAus27b]|nr:hypothetical protein B0O80DRAFT_444469 [Mortierella sp. GBAus27b]
MYLHFLLLLLVLARYPNCVIAPSCRPLLCSTATATATVTTYTLPHPTLSACLLCCMALLGCCLTPRSLVRSTPHSHLHPSWLPSRSHSHHSDDPLPPAL